MLLSGQDRVRAGNRAVKTEEITSVKVGEQLLGRVLDALGHPLDGGPEPQGTTASPVEREAPPLAARGFVAESLATGIRVINALLPIGRGQRELIIGDPSTGKSSLALDAMINQKNSDVVCVYTIIGQKKAQVLKIVEELKAHGDFSRTTSSPPTPRAPTGCSTSPPMPPPRSPSISGTPAATCSSSTTI